MHSFPPSLPRHEAAYQPRFSGRFYRGSNGRALGRVPALRGLGCPTERPHNHVVDGRRLAGLHRLEHPLAKILPIHLERDGAAPDRRQDAGSVELHDRGRG